MASKIVLFKILIKLCNLQQLKIAVYTYRSPHFCFACRRSCDSKGICCIDAKTI